MKVICNKAKKYKCCPKTMCPHSTKHEIAKGYIKNYQCTGLIECAKVQDVVKCVEVKE